MRPEWAARDEERYPLPDETISAAVYRVVTYWQEHQRITCFDSMPDELAAEFPEVFGQMDRETLGVLIATMWLYLGGRGTVTERVCRKWFHDLVSGQAPT